MGKVIPILLALLGLGGGIGAGLALRPAPQPIEINPCGDAATAQNTAASDEQSAQATHGETTPTDTEFLKLNNQFVVPIIQDGLVTAMVVLSLSLELESGHNEEFYKREPKIRDKFLQVLFDHANNGGFNGQFTDAARLRELRLALRESATSLLGPIVDDVLVTDIARQDV